MKRISPEEIQNIRKDTELPLHTCILDMISFAEAVGTNAAQAQLDSCEKELREIMTKMDHRIEALSLVLECENPIDRMAVRNVINGWQVVKQEHQGD